LTGDVGRGCGDASRALLFIAIDFIEEFLFLGFLTHKLALHPWKARNLAKRPSTAALEVANSIIVMQPPAESPNVGSLATIKSPARWKRPGP
jgi:hypothetical protein